MSTELDPTISAATKPSGHHAVQTGATPYELGETLGRGGMGEVVLARDPKIGRDVALKRMRAAEPSPDAVARFLREAKIQARLDHLGDRAGARGSARTPRAGRTSR